MNAVYDDRNFDLFMQVYRDYNVEYDPVLNNIEQTPWAYLDVKGTRSAIQVTQGRWALEHGQAGWETLMLGGGVGLLLGVVGASGNGGNQEAAVSHYDIVPFRTNTTGAGFEKHHGVLDAWAQENKIPGYDRKGAPTIVLTPQEHNATRAEFGRWRAETYGSATASVPWSKMSPQEVQALTERMFDAAGIPTEIREAYYRAFNQFLYR